MKSTKFYWKLKEPRVKIDGDISEIVVTYYGVPQDMVLELLLFNFYINDIHIIINKGKLVSNTVILCAGEKYYHSNCKFKKSLDFSLLWFDPDKFKINFGQNRNERKS